MVTETVSGYRTKDGKSVSQYHRNGKPKKHEGIHFEQYKVKVARDDQGRLFGEKKYKQV